MRNIWRAPSASISIDQVIAALTVAFETAPELADGVPSGATKDAIAAAERTLGFTFPPELLKLYTAFDGGYFVGGNFNLLPLIPKSDGDLALTTASDFLRTWDWPAPPELVVFGNDGSDEQYGLWITDPPVERPPVIDMGAVFEDESFAVAGDDLASFLAGHCGFHLVTYFQEGYDLAAALEALGVPKHLREMNPNSDRAYVAFLNWASPNLPDKSPDPYERGITREQINAFVRDRPDR